MVLLCRIGGIGAWDDENGGIRVGLGRERYMSDSLVYHLLRLLWNPETLARKER